MFYSLRLCKIQLTMPLFFHYRAERQCSTSFAQFDAHDVERILHTITVL